MSKFEEMGYEKQRNWTYFVSNRRNELYIFDKEDNQLFSVHGHELDIDFTSMTENEIYQFIEDNYSDIIEDLL